MAKDRISISNTAIEDDQTSLPDIPYLSDGLPPFCMNDTILATPSMASLAFSALYSHAGYDSQEATNANLFLSPLHARHMGILSMRVSEALLRITPSTPESRQLITNWTMTSDMAFY